MTQENRNCTAKKTNDNGNFNAYAERQIIFQSIKVKTNNNRNFTAVKQMRIHISREST